MHVRQRLPARMGSGRRRIIPVLRSTIADICRRQLMRVLDWVYFAAEHDDHHLAKARRAILSTDKQARTEREDANQ